MEVNELSFSIIDYQPERKIKTHTVVEGFTKAEANILSLLRSRNRAGFKEIKKMGWNEKVIIDSVVIHTLFMLNNKLMEKEKKLFVYNDIENKEVSYEYL